METDRLVRLRDVAERLGVSLRTVYREIAESKLPRAVRVRGRSMMPESDVVAYLEKLKLSRVTC